MKTNSSQKNEKQQLSKTTQKVFKSHLLWLLHGRKVLFLYNIITQTSTNSKNKQWGTH